MLWIILKSLLLFCSPLSPWTGGNCGRGTVTPGQPGWVPPPCPETPPGWKCPSCCWSLTRRLANTQKTLWKRPCCWWHLWDPGWEQSRSRSPGGSTGTPPGPDSELVYMELAELHPASPALLPALRQQLPTAPGVFSSAVAVAVWMPRAVLELGCKHGIWLYSRGSDTGQAVSSVRGEISGGSGVPGEGGARGGGCSCGTEPTLCPWARRARSQTRFLQPPGVSSFWRARSKTPTAMRQTSPALQKCSYRNNVLLRGYTEVWSPCQSLLCSCWQPPEGQGSGAGPTPRTLL